ncbi:MAG: N-acetylneuraminate synthase family protein [Candidatus Omnitrophota bacterium]
MAEKRKKAIILGAGPLGLVTGWQLLLHDWSVDIYEKEAQTGGACKTWKWDGFLVDTGPHIYHTPDQELAKFWEAEFAGLFIKDDFWCKNVKGEGFTEFWDYPLSWESISRYPKTLKEKIVRELDNLSLETKAKARNYAEYMQAQVGPTLNEIFFKKYPAKIWGISTDDMAADWAPKRIEFRQKVTPFYHKQWNAAGKYGTGCIFQRIEEKILKLGGKIHINAEVTGISAKSNTITAVKINHAKNIPVGSDDMVISSLPITLLSRFLGYASKLHFRSLRTVYLAYNKETVLPQGIHWLYYDSDKVLFHRITEPKKLSAFVAPKGKTYLAAEITCDKDDRIYSMEEKTLIKKIAEQVEQVGLARRKDMINGATHRQDAVYPVQYRGYQNELAKVRSRIAKYQQLYSLGTGGEFHYSDIQVIFHKAFDTAAMLCGKDSSFAQVLRCASRCELNRQVTIGRRKIGEGNRAYIIAEAGLNHNGSIDLAKKLIDAAKKTGCDAIKFQAFRAESRVSKKVKAARYAEKIIGTEETLFEMFDRLSLSFKAQEEIFRYARKTGIEIFSTPFDFESVDFLESLGVKAYKIASMDLVNLPFIRYVAKTKKPVILSTGMSTLGQIEEAVEAVASEGNSNLVLLHCNSSYPAAPEEMNLNVMRALRECFAVPVGLSDHTLGLFVSRIAIAIGANVIERHFTLNRMFEGPDHILSSEPEEMKQLVDAAKMIPLVLGDSGKRIQPNEYDTLNAQRKSLYAARRIRKGEAIASGMIAVKGPGGGILPRYMDIVVGRNARTDIEQDYPITWDVI